MKQYNFNSNLEKVALEKFGKKEKYPFERIKIIEVPNFSLLGKIVALRFIEWLQLNEEGVFSLPTGKTPEYFIEWASYYINNWNKKEIKEELRQWGLSEKKPNLKNYYFVQIDEFYPINSERTNSFNYYIKNFYVKKFSLNPKKIILIDTWKVGCSPYKNLSYIFPDEKVDLSLRYRKPKTELEKLQQKAIYQMDGFAMKYEEKIEQLGGIGFFLGGIGPDGHIGFNIRGSDHNSTTRLLNINYETAAASSTDLGGIEVARGKCVVTIGLKTITQNPTTTAIIMAAGESKAKVVMDAVENPPSILYPATSLQKLAGSRFYLTKGATSLLKGRKIDELENKKLEKEDIEKIIIDISNKEKVKISNLDKNDFEDDIFGKILIKKNINIKKSLIITENDIKRSIKKGTEVIKNTTFLHTSPHHDDIMLGYLPYILHLVRTPSNQHFFATFTSGFTSVTNHYLLTKIQLLEKYLQENLLFTLLKEKDYFQPENINARNRDVFQYLDRIAANSKEMIEEGESRRMLRNIVEITGKLDLEEIKRKIKKYKIYLINSYPGKKDIPEIQTLKGMVREWEEELLWSHLGFNCNHIFHLRLPFYTGDIFTPEPEFPQDVKPVINLLEKLNPDIITVALDPEGTGPDTHYKVLQVVYQATKYYKEKYRKKFKIWGYRNIWFKFHPSECNIFVPVSMNSLAIMKMAFDICFGSQKEASFPSYEYDGPFSELSQEIMVNQYSKIKTCLGRDYFYSNKVPRLRATRGFVFIKEMEPEEFFEKAIELKRIMGF